MPLLVPDVRCFKNKITGTATRESIHNSMRGEDIKKHRNGATLYVNGVMFSNLHPITDARIFKVEDCPLDLNLQLLDGSGTYTQVKVRNTDKQRKSCFKTMKAAAPSLKITKGNYRTSHHSSTQTNYIIALGRKKRKMMAPNKTFRFQLEEEEHDISKLASDMELLTEKDFKSTSEHIKKMESVSIHFSHCDKLTFLTL